MAEMTKSFPPTQPNVIASFDFVTFAENTGMVDFNCFIAENTSGETEHMQSQQVYSSNNVTTTAVNDGSFTKIIERNFDLSPFNKRATVRGTATINVPFKLGSLNTGIRNGYVIAKVIKVVATVEDVLVTVQSPTIQIGDNEDKFKMFSLRVVVPNTNFNVGDTLRLSIEGWGQKASGNACLMSIGHSPFNRDEETGDDNSIEPSVRTEEITTLNFFCPFVPDILR